MTKLLARLALDGLIAVVLAALYVALWMRREPEAVTAFRDAEPVVSV